MHILFLLKTSEGGVWALELIKKLRQVYPYLSFSAVMPGGGRHFEEYKAICRRVYSFEFKVDSSFYSRGLKLRQIVVDEKPDIIHSWFTQTTLYARLFLRTIKIPRLFQVVGPLHLETWLFRFFDIRSGTADDYWIATSECIYKIYRTAGVKKEKLFLNYAFIDVYKLLNNVLALNDSFDQGSFKKKYDINENEKIIGTASYMYPPKFWQKFGVKGHEILLKIYEELLKRRSDVILIIAGSTFGDDKKYENKLKELAKKMDSGKILFIGKYDNVFSIIMNFDVFVYPSRSENLGGVFESLLCGIPTVCSRVGGLPELVIDNKTGFCCDLNDICAYVDKIEYLLNNSGNLEDLTRQGREQVINIFDNERNCDRALAIYKSVNKSICL